MFRKHSIAFLSLMACLSCVLFCDCGKNPDQESEEAGVREILVDKTLVTVKVGESLQVTATVVPEKASAKLQWSSDNESIASVSQGLVTGISQGYTTISVSCRNISRKIPVMVTAAAEPDQPDDPPQDDTQWKPAGCVLFDCIFSDGDQTEELNRNNVAVYTKNGLEVQSRGALAQLNRFYAIAQRSVRYEITPGDGTVAVFQSSTADFSVTVDVPGKTLSVAAPQTVREVPFLAAGKDFVVEIGHDYLVSNVRVSDPSTDEYVEITLTSDGSGGVGQGALQPANPVGMQWDYYCFGLSSGAPYTMKRMTVTTPRRIVKLLIYGDSISQPESYFPAADFSQSWTQRIISRLDGDAVSSGRGGGTIVWLQEYIRNELPYINAEYVMVTIGTNGGNTDQNLTDLCKYIRSMGAIPILNNIPCNESGTQVEANEMIDRVRQSLGLKGVKFDLATSVDGDGRQVDKSMMFWEDYGPGTPFPGMQVWHHPNNKGGEAMLERAIQDVPELFKK